MNALTLLEFVKTDDGKARAQSAVSRLNDLWRSDLKAYEIALSSDGTLSARGQIIARPTPDDAKLIGEDATVASAAQKWKGNFGRLFWRVQLKGKA